MCVNVRDKLPYNETAWNYTLCVKLHYVCKSTVCEITHCVQNYTRVPFVFNMEKFGKTLAGLIGKGRRKVIEGQFYSKYYWGGKEKN